MILEEPLEISTIGGIVGGSIILVIFECILFINKRLKRKQEINKIKETIMKAFLSPHLYDLSVISKTTINSTLSTFEGLLTDLDVLIKYNSDNINPQKRYKFIRIISISKFLVDECKKMNLLPGIELYKIIFDDLQDIKWINLPKSVPFLDNKLVTLKVHAWCTVCNMQVDLLINEDISQNIPSYDADSLQCRHCKNTTCLTENSDTYH